MFLVCIFVFYPENQTEGGAMEADFDVQNNLGGEHWRRLLGVWFNLTRANDSFISGRCA